MANESNKNFICIINQSWLAIKLTRNDLYLTIGPTNYNWRIDMSITNNIKVKAVSLKKFLNDKGYPVKHTECIEAVSHMETSQCYNVAKEKALRILKEGESLTFKEMKASNFQVDVVIPMDMDTIMEGIDVVNDIASEAITKSCYALCSLEYAVYPYHYGNNAVAVRVKAYVEDIEMLSELADYEEED